MNPSRDVPRYKKLVFEKLYSFFGKTLAGRIKALTWFSTPNPLLGNVTPRTMVHIGHGDKLLKFIENQLSEDKEVSGS